MFNRLTVFFKIQNNARSILSDDPKMSVFYPADFPNANKYRECHLANGNGKLERDF
jgi:hypothetical protein